MQKIEISIELATTIKNEMRELRTVNLELRNKLESVERILNMANAHMPSEAKTEFVPSSIAALNKLIEKQSKEDEQTVKS